MAEPIRYEDFAISIEPDKDGALKVKVESSPLDRREGPFNNVALPVDPSSWFEELEGSVRGLRGATHDDGSWTVVPSAGEGHGRTLTEQRGQELFDALFQEEVLKLWDECRNRLDDHEKEGLRIRLIFDRRKLGEVESIAFLPWEMLWDPRRKSFVGSDYQTPIVRHVVTPLARAPVVFFEGFQVLLVAPQPEGLRKLDQPEEIRLAREALESLPGVKLVELEKQTLAELRRKVMEVRPHVVHFLGHGDFDEQSGCGGVYFEDESGGRDFVTGQRLGEALRKAQPPVVVLNACGTAMVPRKEGTALPFHVADQLVAMGFTTVVAMQFSISDQAAIEFSKNFYRALVAGFPVDGAVAEARMNMALGSTAAASEWITPTLFMRSPDGFVLDRQKLEGDRLVSSRPTGILGIRTFLHNTAPMETFVPSENILDLTSSFDGRFLRSNASWADSVLSPVTSFLARKRQGHEEVKLLFDAHLSIALAAGWHAGLRAGQPITILQRQAWAGVQELRLDVERRSEARAFEELWSFEELELEGGGEEVALVVSVARPARRDAEAFVRGDLAGRVGRVLLFDIRPKPGNDSLQGTRHALDLVHALDTKVLELGHQQLTRPKHLFLASPVSFAYALGAAVRGWGRVQLYEHDLERTKPQAYTPSLLLDPAQL
ncbi:MAG: SAVED domain-containing protein [Thermoanaerobaculia bacterium]